MTYTKMKSTEISSEDELAILAKENIDSLTDSLLDYMCRDVDALLNDDRDVEAGFRRRLNHRWGAPLDLLDMFIALTTDAGSSLKSNLQRDEVLADDAVLEALFGLHARACQIASEVLVLLRHGYADGAHARWRSIHEISVVSYMICEHSSNLAERYLLHEAVQRYRLACAHQENHERIGQDPVPEDVIERLKARRDALVDRFGRSFASEYGWAAEAIGSERPTFRDLEKQVGTDHMRPFYRMASDNVHANAHASQFRLGLGLSQLGGDTLLTGPSNLGLADPAHSTAISLGQVTINLMSTQPGACNALLSSIILKLQNRIGSEFLKVHWEVEALAKSEASGEP